MPIRPLRASLAPSTLLEPAPDDRLLPPRTATSDATVSRLQLELRTPPPTEEAQSKAVLMAGGLSAEDAARIIERGLTAEAATDLLTVDLLRPSPDGYGPAAVTLSLLAEARGQGALSARRIKARIREMETAVVLRPDGYLVPALGGRPIEKRADLELGKLYQVRSGVLREQGKNTPVAELDLGKGTVGLVLDGVESAVMTGVVGLAHQVKGLLDDPEATLDGMAHGFGRIPETVARFVRKSPELLAAYENAAPEDQLRFVSEALTHVALLATTLLASPAGTSTAGTGLGRVQLQGAELALAGARLEATTSAAALAHLGVDVAVVAGGSAALAESLDLRPSPDPRIGPTTIQEPKTRHQVRDRIARALGDPRDPDVPLAELEEYVELAPHLGEDAVQELKAMILERLEREVKGLEKLPAELQSVKVKQLRAFADETGILIRDALRPRVERPPLSSLSAEARRALRQVEQGTSNIRVTSRRVAEEVLTQYSDYVDTGGWPTSRPRALFGDKRSTYHWDDVFGEDGYLVNHHPTNVDALEPHLQIHLENGELVRVTFPKAEAKK